jgi:hypothetical protein
LEKEKDRWQLWSSVQSYVELGANYHDQALDCIEMEMKLAEETAAKISFDSSMWKFFMLKEYKETMEQFEAGANEPRMEQLYRVQSKLRKLKDELSEIQFDVPVLIDK